jgi:uncharacterized damage-inducible protein DinB
MQVTDLIRYNHIVRGLYLDALAKLPWSEIVANRGLSFECMRNVFLHLTLVEDRWVSYIIPGKFSQWHDIDFDAFKDIVSLEQYVSQVNVNTEAYLVKLTSEELTRQIILPWANKPNMQITIEKGLTHMVLEDMIHYGELSAVLWQMGQEAPYMGFWRYGISEPANASYEPKAPK